MSLDTHPQSLRSEYREFPAPVPLSDYFLCFWTQTISGMTGEYTQQVLPDGCVDLVFINQDPPVAVGPWTDPFAVSFSSGTRILGARLHPGRAPGLLGLPAVELLNQSAPLRALCGAVRNDRFDRVRERDHRVARQRQKGELGSGDRHMPDFTPFLPDCDRSRRGNPAAAGRSVPAARGVFPRSPCGDGRCHPAPSSPTLSRPRYHSQNPSTRASVKGE